MNKKKPIILLVVSVFLIINIFILMYDKISKEHRYEVTAENIITDFSNSVSHNNSINQKFIIHNNQIEAIELHTDQYYRPISDFDLDYKLLNENSEVIYSGDIVLGDIGVNDNILIYFNDKVKGVKEEKLTLELSTKSDGELLLKSNDNENIEISVISSEMTNYHYFGYGIGIFLILLVVIVYFFIFSFNIKFYKIYAFCAIVLGIVITFLIPVGNVPDEGNAHIPIAYHYSNLFLGIHDGETVKHRKCDLDTIYNYTYVDYDKFFKYTNDLGKNENLDKKMVESDKEIVDVNPYSFTYYLSALGITIGRILGLNGILCILLGRLLNFILFICVTTYCIKIIPAFKSIISFVCLLPMTLQQVFSLSYDSIVITLAILIISYTIKLFYYKKLNKSQYAILAISCFLISLCKSFSYSPIVLAPLSYYILQMNIWTKLKEKLNRKKNLIIFIIVSIIILLILFGIYVRLKNTFAEGSMLYLLFHPKLLYLHIRDTLYVNSEFYLSSSLGGSLGLLHIPIYKLILVCYYILICNMLVNHSTNENRLPKFSRMVFLFIFIISFLGILLAMYSWSYSRNLMNNNIILGFQGRYMLPLLPLLLIGICSKGYIKEDIVEYKVLFFSMLFGAITIFSIIIALS